MPQIRDFRAAPPAGLRHATHFDREQAQDWTWAATVGRHIGYEDVEVLNIIDLFALAILQQADVSLSRETEARISAFMADPRLVAVNHRDHNG